MQRSPFWRNRTVLRAALSFRDSAAAVQCGGSDRNRSFRAAGCNGGGRSYNVYYGTDRQRVHRTFHRNKRAGGKLYRSGQPEEYPKGDPYGNRGFPDRRSRSRNRRTAGLKTHARTDGNSARNPS